MAKADYILPVGILGLVIYAGFHNETGYYATRGMGIWTLPIKSHITQEFAGKDHNGIDIHAEVGTRVYSPYAGVVKKVFTGTLGGNQLIIRHDNGYYTGYAHLSHTLVFPGDRVTAGQEIALSGNTGQTTGPHLHFVLMSPTGEPLNPHGIIYPIS